MLLQFPNFKLNDHNTRRSSLSGLAAKLPTEKISHITIHWTKPYLYLIKKYLKILDQVADFFAP